MTEGQQDLLSSLLQERRGRELTLSTAKLDGDRELATYTAEYLQALEKCIAVVNDTL